MNLTVNGRTYEVEAGAEGVTVAGVTYKTIVLRDNGESTVRVGGRPYKVKTVDERTVVVDGRKYDVEMTGRLAPARGAAKPGSRGAAVKGGSPCDDGNSVRAPMPGTVLAVRVSEGEQVTAGAVLLILEAMKMQNEIKSPREGKVAKIAVGKGQTVANGDVMVVIE